MGRERTVTWGSKQLVRVVSFRRARLFDAPSQHHMPWTVSLVTRYPDGGPIPATEPRKWRHVSGFAVHLSNSSHWIEFRRL